MVLESLSTPEKAEKKPYELFFLGAMYAAIAIFLSVWVFREESSIIMILLTVISCVPLLYNTMRFEEEKDISIVNERLLIKEHAKALIFFMSLFIGFVISFSAAFIMLPQDLVQENLFDAQLNTIRTINSNVAGESTSTILNPLNTRLFTQILSNNLKVLIFCIFFSFFYGAGAIFILTWNASVISAAIGSFFRTNISTYASALGFTKAAGYFHIYSISLLRYFLHGIPEILGYFIGGLAGGIISVAVIRHDFGSKLFKHVIRDSFSLIFLAVLTLAIAAVLEVFVTPLFF